MNEKKKKKGEKKRKKGKREIQGLLFFFGGKGRDGKKIEGGR